LLSPKGKKTVHHATEGEGNGLPASVVPPKSAEVHTETTPITKDDEGTEAPVEEVKESFKKAYVCRFTTSFDGGILCFVHRAPTLPKMAR
jgi:hypothetical protein